jgi:hypothetical protein
MRDIVAPDGLLGRVASPMALCLKGEANNEAVIMCGQLPYLQSDF